MPVKKVGCAYGNLKSNGATFVVMSLSGSDVTLTVDGVAYVITMSKLGDDRPTADSRGETWACWYGVQSVSGVSEFTKYGRTTEQDGITETGSMTTAPANRSGANFAIANTTCFNPYALKDDITGWNLLATYMRDPSNLQLLSVMHVDDIYYADGQFAADATATNSQGKAYVTADNSAGNRPAYDFGLKYAAWYGILEPFIGTIEPSHEYDGAALNEDFQYVIANSAFMPQFGDHEFQNNLGWTGGQAMGAYPNGYHKTGISADAVNDGGYDGNGLTVYNAIMKPLQGVSAQNRDTNANHWYVDLGAVRYITIDGTTNAVASVTILGNNQIDDVLDLANGGQWFTLIGNPAIAGRGLPNYSAAISVGNGYPSWVNYSYKDENFIQSEYDRLYVNETQTVDSLMANANTNGNIGALITYRGDWHTSSWLFWEAAASTGKLAESFNEIGLCTLSNSTFQQLYYKGSVADYALDQCKLVGAMSTDYTSSQFVDFKQMLSYTLMTITEVYGTKQTPECVVKQWNVETDSVGLIDQGVNFTNPKTETILDSKNNLWRLLAARRFVRYAGNEGYSLEDTDIFKSVKSSKSSS